MPTNRDTIIPMERQPADPLAGPDCLGALNALLGDSQRVALILGPIQLADGLRIPTGAALRVPVGHELVVVSGQRLREIMPAGVYSAASWLGQPETELHLVDVREHNLEFDVQQEIYLSYPITAHEQILGLQDLRFGLTYRVLAAERAALDVAQPLLGLYDAALHLLLESLNRAQVDQIMPILERVPGELRARGDCFRLGIGVTKINLIGWPQSANIPQPEPSSDTLLAMLEAQLDELRQRQPPALGQVRPVKDGYMVSVPLIDHKNNVMLLRIICDRSYPQRAPQLSVWLDEQRQDYRPALLDNWKPSDTLASLIDAVIAHAD
ncbi:hypothetical protein EKD04_015750 [Chloroflexales bacterium ZM16-3]|nr:hypothetical protein [Chloroflexales bacterium ZM16-3]